MVFNYEHWQHEVKYQMWRKRIGYREIASKVKASPATIHRYVNKSTEFLSVHDFLLICRIVDIEPLQFVIKDSVQLSLF